MTTPESKNNTGPLVAGVDLGGTAVNSTLLNGDGTFLISELCEHPAPVSYTHLTLPTKA